ncbi:MAG: N-acetyl-gamma-glutamyl-phosphate reductase [Clostridiales bacterium]|nr:N-acetyl-gamma-glutamyl-phosphate reductase [Clostridiales bacterium]
MAIRVFVDGAEGTTGLKIDERLRGRRDVEVLSIDPALRKDARARRALLHAADVAFLCLPDDAARESAALAEGSDAIVLDASTAHRVSPGWAYGFPELSPAHRAAIASAGRIAVPGCHATGFLAIVYPLVALGILPRDYPLAATSLSGYSGAGKKAIAQYEAADRPAALDSPRLYALSQAHKHLPEMTAVADLLAPPVFQPVICDFYAGMAISVPLNASRLGAPATPDSLFDALTGYYAGQPMISVSRAPGDGFLPANLLAGDNRLTIYVCGNDERIVLTSLLDNLGKGASGAAMQCMNVALGLPEQTGLL